MKIDFYISSLSSGGAEKVLNSLAKKFAELNHEVSIISLEKRPQFYTVDHHICLYKYDNNSYGKVKIILYDYLSIKKHMRFSNSDISISFLSRCNLLLLFCNFFTKRKIVVSDRNNPLKEHSKLSFIISNLLYIRANSIVIQTKSVKQYYYKVLQKKIAVIENPIDTQALNKQMKEEPIRKKTIISIGRLEAQKDFRTLFLAFEKVAEKYSDWELKVFGQGDMKDELQNYINKLHLENRVTLCGRTEKPYYELKKSSIFVLSSHYEGFPNVLCEAMYAGTLCISSDCISGPRELITHGKNGWLFDIGNSEQLAGLLMMCISKEEELLDIRANAENTVKRLYLDKNIENWRSLVDHICR